jgi:hypothetical protein
VGGALRSKQTMVATRGSSSSNPIKLRPKKLAAPVMATTRRFPETLITSPLALRIEWGDVRSSLTFQTVVQSAPQMLLIFREMMRVPR